MLFRFLIVIPQAMLATGLLLLLMITLIEFADKNIKDRQTIKLPDIFMPETKVDIERVIEKPKKPKIDKTPPPEIPEQEFDRIDGNASLSNLAKPGRINTRLDLNIGDGLQATDGEYLPIVKVAPQYPRRALTRGVEGYVILEYTVTKQGSVKNISVIEAEPEKIFNSAAIKSAERYKYKPRIIDGVAVEVPGVRTKITFKLAD